MDKIIPLDMRGFIFRDANSKVYWPNSSHDERTILSMIYLRILAKDI